MNVADHEPLRGFQAESISSEVEEDDSSTDPKTGKLELVDENARRRCMRRDNFQLSGDRHSYDDFIREEKQRSGGFVKHRQLRRSRGVRGDAASVDECVNFCNIVQ